MGSIYALVALGFVMFYNATGVINFAQGELVALGAYLCVFAIAAFGLPPLLSIGVALLVMMILAPILFLLPAAGPVASCRRGWYHRHWDRA